MALDIEEDGSEIASVITLIVWKREFFARKSRSEFSKIAGFGFSGINTRTLAIRGFAFPEYHFKSTKNCRISVNNFDGIESKNVRFLLAPMIDFRCFGSLYDVRVYSVINKQRCLWVFDLFKLVYNDTEKQ